MHWEKRAEMLSSICHIMTEQVNLNVFICIQILFPFVFLFITIVESLFQPNFFIRLPHIHSTSSSTTLRCCQWPPLRHATAGLGIGENVSISKNGTFSSKASTSSKRWRPPEPTFPVFHGRFCTYLSISFHIG